MNFRLTRRDPPPPGQSAQTDAVASVRMSLEHLKMMTFILRRQVINYERNAGVNIQLPQAVLNGLQIGQEDWNECWRGDS
jgi:hypothetical protein